MTNQELKKIYEANPSDWVVYVHEKLLHPSHAIDTWHKEEPYWYDECEYKLIAKKHEHIADAVIANPDVYIEYLDDEERLWYHADNFIDTYNSKIDYRCDKDFVRLATKDEILSLHYEGKE